MAELLPAVVGAIVVVGMIGFPAGRDLLARFFRLRGPGYALTWAKNRTGYLLTGFGDSSDAVDLADSVK